MMCEAGTGAIRQARRISSALHQARHSAGADDNALATVPVLAAAQGGLSGLRDQTADQLQSPASPDASRVLADYRISPQQLPATCGKAVGVDGGRGPDVEAALNDFQIAEHDFANWCAGLPTIAAPRLDPSTWVSRAKPRLAAAANARRAAATHAAK
jgi:hypothetical protein